MVQENNNTLAEKILKGNLPNIVCQKTEEKKT